MNTLKYSLEYHCYPIWNYNEDNELVDNDLPDELREDTELDSLLLKIQEIFDSLFTDTPTEFSANGFKTEVEWRNFIYLLHSSVELLQTRYGTKYNIECKYNEVTFPFESNN